MTRSLTSRLFQRAAFLPAALLVASASSAQVVASAASSPTATATRRVAAPADTAIQQLESFLQRYPSSPLRPNALFQLGELLVRRADERFNEQQRAGGTGDSASAARASASGSGPSAASRPDYGPAIARYEELVQRYPKFQQIDAAAYTLGTLYTQNQRYADAARMFEIVAGKDSSRFQSEALFRLGDALFEVASGQRGEPRRATFARAATAYERAIQRSPTQGDIYFLSLYKLGWSYYNQATQTNSEAYNKAVQTFGQLVEAYDKLSPEQQSRLGLRGEALEYMAVAFTQVGGAEALDKYFATHGGDELKRPVLRRVAQNLRDQGDYSRAVGAYEAVIADAPTDSAALAAQREIVDIYQNRTLEPAKAQAARLALVERFAPGSAWAQANPGLADSARVARESALRQSGQYLLANAKGDRARYAEAAQIYDRYLNEFANSDSARSINVYYAEALLGQGDFAKAGAQYSRAAYGTPPASGDTAAVRLAQAAGQNAIVAFDSALVRNRTDRAMQDSLFAVTDRFVAAYPQTDVAKKALISKGRRASETQRWDVMAQTFQTYAQNYPNDAYTPTAQKLIGDALYKQGQYAEAQNQWETAQGVARASGKSALADTIARLRTGAAGAFADTLVKQGQYRRAAEEVYVAFADKNPQDPKAPDALRDAIESYMIVVDSARQKNMSADDVTQARDRAIELTNRLVTQYPSYRYRLQYQNLNARLLADAGRRDEAVAALGAVINATPKGAAQADAMVRLAVTLDSLGKKPEAAAAYERFAAAYPSDKRAADAQNNAAQTYIQAGDSASAARAFATFAARFPRDPRAGAAREQRIVLLRATGDSATARTELARLCQNPTSDAARSECAAQRAQQAEAAARATFERGVATFNQYKDEKLVIATKAQLTAAGVKRASARKQALLKDLTTQFSSAIKSGSPEYLAASTYYIGLAQYEYGEFLKNVQLPETLTEEERAAAIGGSTRQAQASYDAAKNTWQALVTKAEQDSALNSNERAARWISLAKAAAGGQVETNPGTE